MLVSFFESVKYVGHLFPVALLRVYMGFYFFNEALSYYQGDFLVRPKLAAMVAESLPNSIAPVWYRYALEMYLLPNWQLFAYILTSTELIIGIALIVGYLVRPVTILGILLCLSFILMTSGVQQEFYKVYLAIFITLGWLGAGRCMGFDYFFYKRRRGIWW